MENEGLGFVVGSVGLLSGEMPYTAFYARKSYIENNNNLIRRFNNAINKGLKFVKEHSDMDVAKIISAQFPDSSLDDIEKIIKRYREHDCWLDNTSINENIYKNLEDMMIDNDLLDNYVDYSKLVLDLNE